MKASESKKRKRKSEVITPVRWSPPTEDQLIAYVNLRHQGYNQTDAYRKIFADAESLTKGTVKKRASELEKHEAISVKAVLKLLGDEDERQIRDEVNGLEVKKELAQDMINGIREAMSQGPLAIHTCIHTVRALSELLGLNSPKEVSLRGHVAQNDQAVTRSRQPPALADMSDEELSRRIKELEA